MSSQNAPIKPLGDRVVATRDKAADKTAGGLYLPDSAKEKPVAATVAAVGPDATDITVGDKILYKEYSTTELTIDGTDYLIVKQEDILGTLAA